MAILRPFCALRYRPERLQAPLDAVVAPPYDVISADQQDALYKRNPHNCIRLILNRQGEDDSPTDNRYTRSAAALRAWRAEGVLAEDSAPAFYVYEQTYSVAAGYPPQRRTYTRRGFFAALKLEPFGKGCVFPHEETFSSPKADRLNLFRACRANFSPVFGLVPDPQGDLARLLAGAAQATPPEVSVREDQGVEDRLWRVTAPGFQAALRAACAPRSIFIADGHHRYETACNYRDERRAQEPGAAAEQPFDSVLMVCVPMSDPGLFILPTHRLVQGSPLRGAEFLKRAGEWFEARPAGAAELAALAEDSTGPLRFGLVLAGGEMKILVARPALAEAMARTATGHSAEWRGLDTAVLQELILKGLLNLNVASHGGKDDVVYTKDVSDVLSRLSAPGPFDLGFVLRLTRIEQVRQVAEHGERMPQKSTYFYPKLLSGLVMRLL